MPELPKRDPACECFDGCAVPDCSWDGLSCTCPAHGFGTAWNREGFEGSCDHCRGCKAARDPDLF